MRSLSMIVLSVSFSPAGKYDSLFSLLKVSILVVNGMDASAENQDIVGDAVGITKADVFLNVETDRD